MAQNVLSWSMCVIKNNMFFAGSGGMLYKYQLVKLADNVVWVFYMLNNFLFTCPPLGYELPEDREGLVHFGIFHWHNSWHKLSEWMNE